jgi:hypothetical protein
LQAFLDVYRQAPRNISAPQQLHTVEHQLTR